MAAGYYPQSDFDILNSLNQVIVKQRPPGLRGNKFEVRTDNDQVLFKMKDESSFLNFGANVDMVAYDTQKRRVFSFRRPVTFRQDKMEVSVLDQVVSIIRQEVTFVKPVLYINDAHDRQLFRIKGDFGNFYFKIQTVNKETIGSIDMIVTFFGRDKYRITFPPNLSVELKTAMIGACILIDYRYHRK